jgi:hypothetical protein
MASHGPKPPAGQESNWLYTQSVASSEIVLIISNVNARRKAVRSSAWVPGTLFSRLETAISHQRT